MPPPRRRPSASSRTCSLCARATPASPRPPRPPECFAEALLARRGGCAGISAPAAAEPEARSRALWAPLGAHLRQLQAAGVLDDTLAADWMLAAFRGVLRAAVTELDAGRL